MNKPTASPFSTGGGGTRFEWLVATSYVVRLLRGEGARGLPFASTVVEVRLQQATKDYPVDDVVVVGFRGTRASKLALQVKHSICFAPNELFSNVMGACWRHFTAPTFDQENDFVGVAIGEGSNILKIRTHLQELLLWARAHRTHHSFYIQVAQFKAKANLLSEISQALDTGTSRHIGKERIWRLLRRFVVLSFDFDTTGSRDSTDCWNDLLSVVCRRSSKLATALFDGIYGLVSRLSTAAGEIDYDTLRNELAEHIPMGGVLPQRTPRATLVRQVSKQLLKEKKSKKYIPDVFTAIDSIKDAARYFSHPIHFSAKPVDEFLAIDTSFLDRLHTMLCIPLLTLKLPKRFSPPSHLSQVPARCGRLRSHFETFAKERLEDYYRENWDNLRRQIPAETRYVFDDAKYVLRNPGCCIKYTVENLATDLFLMEARVFLLTSRAGQGKTNFVCDFVENFLLLHRIPCLLLTGRELRHMPTDQLGNNLAELISGNAADDLDSALRAVGSLCQESNTPFVIIFDGINEHPDLACFAVALENTIEQLLAFPFVKVIITCRSEYFSERFSNLRAATFSDSIHEVQEIHHEMPERHRHWMRAAYFRFFNIEPSYMTDKVRQTLEGDPLLLRFFCEAYGNPEARGPITLPAMADVYREVVFRKYLDKKLDEVAARQTTPPGAGVPLARQYKYVLRSVVSVMVARTQFADIPLSSVATSLQPALAELIAEDVFVRKDLVAGRSALDSDAEVINFTFDEFRDYLLADYLLHVVLPNDGEKAFRAILSQFTEDRCPVAEGVMRFVFYEAKKPECDELHALIKTMPWYDTVFLQCIFSVEERSVTDADIQRISNEFSRDPANAQQILFALMRRWDTAALPRLNIDVLFKILDGLSDDTFNRLVRPIFYNPMRRHTYYSNVPYEIERFSSDLRSLVTRSSSAWDTNYTKLVELLIYLFGIEGHEYDFPAYSLFQELAAQRPDNAVAMLSDHLDIALISVKARIWEMLAEIATHGIGMSAELVAQATAGLRNEDQGASRVKDEMRRFLVACRDKLKVKIADDIVLTQPHIVAWFDKLRNT